MTSPRGDLSGAPAYIPGSPHHPGGTIRGGKAAGAYYGDDQWCSDMLCKLLSKKLANLDLIDHIVDYGKITNALQLRTYLIRAVASAIPSHWMRLMRPCVTEAAAALCDARVAEAFALYADLATSPAARRQIAELVAGLRSDGGGFGLAAFKEARDACFLSTYTATRPAIVRIYPRAAALPADSTLASAAASACTALATTLSAVRDRFDALDMTEYHCVDGTVETDYHPYIPDAFELPSPDTMFTTPSSTTTRLREKQLNMVVDADRWMRTLDRINAFDAANTDATIKRREAKRFISASQTGAGAFLHVSPDRAIRGSAVTSTTLLSAIQYRAGAYLTVLAPVLDTLEARGKAISQSDRIGDTAINSSNATTRHNGVNRCVHNARAAVATGTLRLGDKGDGSARARGEAARKFDMFNKGHVPDIVEIDAIDTLYETKCWTACKEKQAMGHGSTKKGGAYSENEGSHIAFGGTAEHARHLTLGCKQRGRADQRPFDHATGTGYVAQHRGHYHDALSHHRHVVIVLVETTGAVHSDTVGMLYAWHNEARSEGHADRTVYGKARTATRSFYAHHLRLISLAAVVGAALPVARWAKAAKSRLVRDVTITDFMTDTMFV